MINARPIKLRMVPSVVALGPACKRLYTSGIRTNPIEAISRTKDPKSVIIAPTNSIFFLFLGLQTFF